MNFLAKLPRANRHIINNWNNVIIDLPLHYKNFQLVTGDNSVFFIGIYSSFTN